MTDITFITSNQTKLAHIRHLCKGYDVNILQHKKFFYNKKGYEEPRIYDRDKLLEESIKDAIERWRKNVSSYGEKLFFIEDTSVRIDALSDSYNEVPGVDIKYWMQSHNFAQLDTELKKKENNRKVSVSSHIVLFLTDELKKKEKTEKDYFIFKSISHGSIVHEEQCFGTQILYPWLDNKTFNKWFVPDGFDLPISMLDILDAEKSDFRKDAFEQMLNFLKKHGEIKHNQKELQYRLHFNPLYVVCGPTCAGKTTIGKLLLEKYDYYHIEASDFMSLKYFETHGTKFFVDKHDFAAKLLKINPLVVVESIINFIISKKIFDNFIVTGFRAPDEVSKFLKILSSQNIKMIYITADLSIRYIRWINRQRDAEEYSVERFTHINKLQESMGLLDLARIQNSIHYENVKDGLINFCNDFQDKIISVNPIQHEEINIGSIISLQKMPLEKAILIVLAMEYRKNESIYHTTTEISRLINNTFNELKKNKNNVSRYFNQAYYPYYEIKKENNKNKYKLSPTGYSEAIFIIRGIVK